METEEKDGLREKVRELVDLILSMSGYSQFNAEIIVYWCIATYGLESIRKFPILVIAGVFQSGKTTTLEMVQTLAKQPYDTPREDMLITGTISDSMAGKLLSKRGTFVMDEADKFDESYLPHVFDEKSGKLDKQDKTKDTGWNPLIIRVKCNLVMHRREPFTDPANEDRCITITAHRVQLQRAPDMRALEPYQETLEKVNERFCNWYELPESGKSRAIEKWRIVMHVAEKLGNTTFIEKAESQIKMDSDTDVTEEFNVSVFRHILMDVKLSKGTDKITGFKQRVETKAVKEGINSDRAKKISPHSVNSTAKKLGFETGTLGGTSYIYLHQDEAKRFEQMRNIAERIGYRDGALE